MAETIKLVSTVQPGKEIEVRQFHKALDMVRKGKWTVDMPIVREQQAQQQQGSQENKGAGAG